MSLPEFDARTKALFISALEMAWLTFTNADTWTAKRKSDMTARLTQLLAAAEAGERDRAKLVKAALEGIEH